MSTSRKKFVKCCNVHMAKIGDKDYKDTMLAQLNEFRKTGQFTNVVIKAENVSINAHKNILAAASPYFLGMFSGHFPESEQDEIELQQVDPDSLQLVIDFMYTRYVELHMRGIQGLFETASYLQMEELVELCAQYIVKHLMEAGNVLGIKNFGERHSNFTLLVAADDYIHLYFKDVMRCDEFAKMSFEQLRAILSCDEVFLLSDELLLRGLVRWVEYDIEERLQHMIMLLNYIQPACVSPEVIHEQPLLHQKDTRARKVLREVMRCGKNGGARWRIFAMNKSEHRPRIHGIDLGLIHSRQILIDYGYEGEEKEEIANFKLKPMSNPAFAVSMAGFKNIIYVQGGCVDRNPYDVFFIRSHNVGRSRRDSCYYDLSRDQWHEMQPMLLERSYHRSLVEGDLMYALGGCGLQGVTGAVECRSLITDKTTFCSSMLVERSTMGAVVCDRVLYVMGGEKNDANVYAAERYDPRIGLWHELPELPEGAHYHTCATMGVNHIVCCSDLNDSMERLDLRANRWETIHFRTNQDIVEVFTVGIDLYSINNNAVSRYDVNSSRWRTLHETRPLTGWSSAIALPTLKYDLPN